MLQTLHTKGFFFVLWEDENVEHFEKALSKLEIYPEGLYLDPYHKLINLKDIRSPILITPDGMFFGEQAIRSYINLRRLLDQHEAREEESQRVPQLQVQFCLGCGTGIEASSIVAGRVSKAEYTCEKCKMRVVITANSISFMEIRRAAS